jgi:hypothetical protein
MYWDLWYWYGSDLEDNNNGCCCNGGGGRVTGVILTCILAVLCTAMVVITIISPKGADGASQIFGYELRIVESNSMEECEATDVSKYEIGSFSKNTMIIVALVPEREDEAFDWYSEVEVGDVLTVRYTYDRQITLTHRVTKVTLNEDGKSYTIELQGDNVNSDASQLTQVIDTSKRDSRDYVIGKVIWKSYSIGSVVSGLQRFVKSFAE